MRRNENDVSSLVFSRCLGMRRYASHCDPSQAHPGRINLAASRFFSDDNDHLPLPWPPRRLLFPRPSSPHSVHPSHSDAPAVRLSNVAPFKIPFLSLLDAVAPSADARIVIKNVRLFTGDEVINSGVLVLKAGKIVSVTQTDQAAGELLGDKDIVIDGALLLSP